MCHPLTGRTSCTTKSGSWMRRRSTPVPCSASSDQAPMQVLLDTSLFVFQIISNNYSPFCRTGTVASGAPTASGFPRTPPTVSGRTRATSSGAHHGARAASSGAHHGARAASSGAHHGARAASSGAHHGARAASSGAYHSGFPWTPTDSGATSNDVGTIDECCW